MRALEANVTVIVGEVGTDLWIGLCSCAGMTGRSTGRHSDPVAAAVSAFASWFKDSGELSLAMAFDGSSFDVLEKALSVHDTPKAYDPSKALDNNTPKAYDTPKASDN